MSTALPPPPPPPPPPPRKPFSGDETCDDLFNLLPAELLLMIIRYAGVGNIMNLALAIYPTLQRHRIAPELTEDTYINIVRMGSVSARYRTPFLPQGLDRMPLELWLQVARDLEPMNILSMMMALGAYPRGSLTPETAQRMRGWWRKSKNKDGP
ncbi:hypothetical protein BKA58DRAFT_192140 [Alternaria rosae]|uniref:uncharacterized protein n=1 Tax=Alternaria rosae TaxID=1187941 RepID=UPI001E8EC856|nr:uncharacterized protein BKA58DRAFT_192140 [Alternaria rosae]KAH6868308.1 hypothetical protein BKA58DRAFT_192140 [Alternaria rosae]